MNLWKLKAESVQYMETAIAAKAVPATARVVADPSQYCLDYHCPESTEEVRRLLLASQEAVNPPLIGMVAL